MHSFTHLLKCIATTTAWIQSGVRASVTYIKTYPYSRLSITVSRKGLLLLLTRRSEGVTLFRRLELLLHCLLERRFRQARRTPHLELDMGRIIQPVSKEHGGEVHISEVPSNERREPVLGEGLDPFRPGAIVQVGIVGQGMDVAVPTHAGTRSQRLRQSVKQWNRFKKPAAWYAGKAGSYLFMRHGQGDYSLLLSRMVDSNG